MILAVLHNIIELDDTILFVATFDPIERIEKTIIAYRSSIEIDETPPSRHSFTQFRTTTHVEIIKNDIGEIPRGRGPESDNELCQTAMEDGIGGAKQMPHGGDSEICGESLGGRAVALLRGLHVEAWELPLPSAVSCAGMMTNCAQ
ncbi:unnamed protein product [Calypogeia fissa]